MKSGILDKIFETLYKKSKHGREMEDTNNGLSEIHKPALRGIKGQQIKLDIDSVKKMVSALMIINWQPLKLERAGSLFLILRA